MIQIGRGGESFVLRLLNSFSRNVNEMVGWLLKQQAHYDKRKDKHYVRRRSNADMSCFGVLEKKKPSYLEAQ